MLLCAQSVVATEVFLKLLPLLRAAGIVTLGQALAASREHRMSRIDD